MIQARPHLKFLWRRRVFEDGKQRTEHKIITTACIYQEIEGRGRRKHFEPTTGIRKYTNVDLRYVRRHGVGGGKIEKSGAKRVFSYLQLTICIVGPGGGVGATANEGKRYGLEDRETATLKPQTHRIQYIRSRKTGGSRREAGTHGKQIPSPSLHCCLHSSGFAVAPPFPFPPFPPFLGGGGAEPSESES